MGIEVGDVVRLKAYNLGPDMVVNFTSGDNGEWIECVWWDSTHSTFCSYTFSVKCLDKVEVSPSNKVYAHDDGVR